MLDEQQTPCPSPSFLLPLLFGMKHNSHNCTPLNSFPSSSLLATQQEEALWMLEKRIEAVDGVVQYLDAKVWGDTQVWHGCD